MNRVTRAWQALGQEQRLAAVAALALFVTMFLPWYQQNGVTRGVLISRDLNAFAVFSFIEATILLASLLVLVTLFSRAEGRLRLPGSDAPIVLAAGAWAALMLIIRLFDKPGVSGDGTAADVGVQWGIFFALAAAGLLSYAGAKLRAAGQPRTRLLRTVSETSNAEGGFAEAEGGFAEAEGGFAEAEGRFAEAEGRFAEAEGRFAEVIPDKVVSAHDVRRSPAAATNAATAARGTKSARSRIRQTPGTDSEQLSFDDTAGVNGEPRGDASD